MPGNHGPPSMRLEEKQRTDSEIVWADGIGVRVGGTIGFVIVTAVSAAFIPGGCRMIAAIITDPTARENLTHWNGGALVIHWAGVVIEIPGAVFCAWMWLWVAGNLLRSYAREEWHLFPTEQRAEFRRKPLFRKWACEMFEAGTVTAVHLENEQWPHQEEHQWSVLLEGSDARKRIVAHGYQETELRRLAADFATTFGLSFST